MSEEAGEKGEIECFVMKKTPGRKKRVKFAVVYNPKSGKTCCFCITEC